MSRVIDRAFEVAAATFARAPRDGVAHPFGFDEHPPYCWRLSPDVWTDLRDEMRSRGEYWVPDEPSEGSTTLLGELVGIDESLPPNSMLLEPVIPYLPGSLVVTIR